MKFFSLTSVAVIAAFAYIFHTVWEMYGLWNPQSCKAKNQNCLLPYTPKNVVWDLKVYCTKAEHPSSFSDASLIAKFEDLNFEQEVKQDLTYDLPPVAKKNGSLFVHALLHIRGKDPTGEFSIRRTAGITQYRKPLQYFQLLGNGTSDQNISPITHWRPNLKVHIMTPPFNFMRNNFPGELIHLVKETRSRKYLPLLYIDEMNFRARDLVEITRETENVTLRVTYSPISIGKLRLWNTLTRSMNVMGDLGFNEEDFEQIKDLFTDTNIWFLSLTFFVSTFHLLFEFLAFKNDVSYWKERKTMAGLSFHTVMYRCISTVIIFLYLMEEQSSLIVVIPAGIGSIIELWKVTKAFKVKLVRNGWKVTVHFGDTTTQERETEQYDQKAIRYLSYVLYPLSIGGAVYSLFYVPHKSWYSWAIKSLVNGVYAFGFLFMLPQLFINYKLKSVAHLPWRAFTYKAFNTFIDDIFAFIIKMPTSHRIACFRDDVVFFLYLYQRWLYPVDKSRANEYGIVYEDYKEKKE